MFIDIIKVFIL